MSDQPWIDRNLELIRNESKDIQSVVKRIMRVSDGDDIPVSSTEWLGSPEKREKIFRLFFGDLTPVIEYAYQQRAQFPFLCGGAIGEAVRASGDASFADEGVEGWIRDLLREVGPHALSISWPMREIHPSFKGSRGEMFLGIASNLPDSGPLLDLLLPMAQGNPRCLIYSNQKSALDALSYQLMQPEMSFGTLQLQNFLSYRLLDGSLEAAKRVIDAFINRRTGDHPCLAEQFRRYQSLLDDRAPERIAAFQNPDVKAVIPFLIPQTSVDVRALEPVAPRLFASDDIQCRRAGVLAYGILERLGVPTPLQALSDPDFTVAALAAKYGLFPGDPPEAIAALARFFERIESFSVELKVEGAFSVPLEQEGVYVLSWIVHRFWRKPLDRLVPLMPHLNRVLRSSLMDDLKGRTQFTPVEIDMLGLLASDRNNEIKQAAPATLAAQKLDIDQAIAGAKDRLKFPKKPAKPKVVMGPWRKALDRIAKLQGKTASFSDPATPKTLAQLEKELGLALPAELRELLLETNGCQFDGTNIVAPLEELSVYNSQVEETNTGRKSPADLQGILFFYDLENGDYIGIRTTPGRNKKEKGELIGSIVLYEHETSSLRFRSKNFLAYLKTSTE